MSIQGRSALERLPTGAADKNSQGLKRLVRYLIQAGVVFMYITQMLGQGPGSIGPGGGAAVTVMARAARNWAEELGGGLFVSSPAGLP